jgi:hypothetical protein
LSHFLNKQQTLCRERSFAAQVTLRARFFCFIDGAKKRGTKVKKILTPDSRQIDSRRFKWSDSGAMRHIPPKPV